jgi:hypothetical protein
VADSQPESRSAELWEELVGSFPPQVCLYHWLEANDYGRILSDNDVYIKDKRMDCLSLVSVGLSSHAELLRTTDLGRLVDLFNRTYAGKMDSHGALIPLVTLPAHFEFGDPLVTQDLRLGRNFPLGERIHLVLIGEVFMQLLINLTIRVPPQPAREREPSRRRPWHQGPGDADCRWNLFSMYCRPVGQVIFANWLATTCAMSGKSPIHSSRRLVPGSRLVVSSEPR